MIRGAFSRRRVGGLAALGLCLSGCTLPGVKKIINERRGAGTQVSTSTEQVLDTHVRAPSLAKDDHHVRNTQDAESLGSALFEVPSVATCTGKQPLPARVWRLTERQVAKTIAATFGSAFTPLAPRLGDTRGRHQFGTEDTNLVVGATAMRALLLAAEAVSAKALVDHPPTAACVSASGDACLTDLIAKAGRTLWRRAPDTTERASLLGHAQALLAEGVPRAQAVRAVIEGLIVHPAFLYRSELGVPSGVAGRRTLTPLEVASFLSYTLWDAPPDEALLTSAESGKLSEPAELQSQLARMLSSPNAAAGAQAFFGAWLGVDNLPATRKAGAYATAFTEPLRADLRTEFDTFVKEMVFTERASVSTLFSAKASYLNTRLATHYGVTGAPSSGFGKVALAADKSAGLFTLGAFLTTVSDEASKNMVRRGDFVLTEFLCSQVGAPPPNVFDATTSVTPEERARMTSRQVFEKLHSSQAACAGCHQILDPLGGAFENFDPLGRYGTLEGTLTIDSSVNAQSAMFGDAKGAYPHGTKFLEALARSKKFQGCFSMKFYQFASGKRPTQGNSCDVARLVEGTERKGGKAIDALETLGSLELLTTRAE